MKRVTDALPPPVKCDACRSRSVRYLPEKKNRRAIYTCFKCKASVGCHHNTNIPLGYMATASTRALRAKAHTAFDPLWKTN